MVARAAEDADDWAGVAVLIKYAVIGNAAGWGETAAGSLNASSVEPSGLNTSRLTKGTQA